MIGPQTLRGRLLAAQILLVATVVGAGMLAVRLLTPVLFERGQRNQGGTGPGQGQRQATPGLTVSAETLDAYNEALTTAVIIAAFAGLIAAVVLAAVFSRILLRRLSEVKVAAQHLAGGDYRSRINLPPETELAELAKSVNTLGATLAASEEARARLMSDVAHEIRNPLTTIEGYMEGLTDGVLPPNAETFSEVAGEAHRIKRIAEDLSFMSQAQEGSVPYERGAVDLADLARQTTQRLQPRSAQANVKLMTSIDMPLPVVADSGRITQLLTNVISNALAHTPPDGTITVTGRIVGSNCEISITDTGEGIPTNRLDIIFERFTRFREGAGIGIGLNIARSIATDHGGQLVAHSEGTGHGATFTLTLPTMAPPANRI